MQNHICILVIQKKFKICNKLLFIYQHLHPIYIQYRIFSITYNNSEIEMNLSLSWYNIFNYIHRNLLSLSNIYYIINFIYIKC